MADDDERPALGQEAFIPLRDLPTVEGRAELPQPEVRAAELTEVQPRRRRVSPYSRD